MLNTIKNIGTAVLILTGIELVVAGYVYHWYWWATFPGALVLFAGLDLRYYAIRVKAKIKIEHKLDEVAKAISEDVK